MEEHPRRLARSDRSDGMLGEEFGDHGAARPPLDRRPDRRHAELLPRDPDLGDADRARGGRRARARRRLGAGARPALVGRARRGRVRRRRADPRLRVSSRSRTRCCASRSAAAAARLAAPLLARARVGDFWAHMLVAEGAVEVAIEPSGRDLGPGGGAAHRRGSGRAIQRSARRRAGDGGTAISSNGLLHEALLEASTS